MKTTKKVLTLLLSLAIMVTFMPVTAFADGEPGEGGGLKPGDGKYMIETEAVGGGSIVVSGDAVATGDAGEIKQALFTTGDSVEVTITPEEGWWLDKVTITAVKPNPGSEPIFETNEYYNEPNEEESQIGLNAIPNVVSSDASYTFPLSSNNGEIEDIYVKAEFDIGPADDEFMINSSSNGHGELRFDPEANKTIQLGENTRSFYEKKEGQNDISVTFDHDDCFYLNYFDLGCFDEMGEPTPIKHFELQYVDDETGYHPTGFALMGEYGPMMDGENYVEFYNVFDEEGNFVYTANESVYMIYAHFEYDEDITSMIQDDNYAYALSGDALTSALATELFERYFENPFDGREYEFASAEDVEKNLTVSGDATTSGGVANKGQYTYTLKIDDGTTTEPFKVDILEKAEDLVIRSGDEDPFVVPSGDAGDYIAGDKDYYVYFKFDRQSVGGEGEQREGEVLPIDVYGNGVELVRTVEWSGDRAIYKMRRCGTDTTFLLNMFDTDSKPEPFEPGDNQVQLQCIVHGQGTVGIGDIEDISVNNESIWKYEAPSGDEDRTVAYKVNVASADAVEFKCKLQDVRNTVVYVGNDKRVVSGDGTFELERKDYDKVVNVLFINESDDEYATAVINHTLKGQREVELKINGNRIYNTDGYTSNHYTTAVAYPSGDASGDVTFDFAYEEDLTYIKVNEVEVTEETLHSLTDAYRLSHWHDFHYHYEVTVPKAEVYNIVTEMAEEDRDRDIVSNLGWNRTGEDYHIVNREDSIEGGQIRLVKAVYNGEPIEIQRNEATVTINKGDIIFEASGAANYLEDGSAFSWVNERAISGDPAVYEEGRFEQVSAGEFGTVGAAYFPDDTTLTVELKPDYGKQLVEFAPIGMKFIDVTTDENNVSRYTFNVTRGGFHLGAVFKDVENTTTLSGDPSKVTSAEYSIEGTPVDSGTINMNVEVISGDDNGATVDITMKNLIYDGVTGKANDNWTEQVSELDNGAEATIRLAVDGIDAGDEVSVVREHGGISQEIPATVNSSGEVVFTSGLFSTYTITKTSSGGGGSGGGGSTEPTEPEPKIDVDPTSGGVIADIGGETKVEGDKASAVISEDTAKAIVEAAAKSGATEIKLDASVKESVDKTELEIPMVIAEAADTNGASVEIATNVGSVVLDKQTVKGLAKTDADSITVSVEKTDASGDDKAVFDITLTAVKDGKATTISKLQGTAQVVAPLPSGLKAEEVCGLYLNGKLAEKVTTKVDGKNVVLTVKHFSTYGIMSNDEADKLFKKSAEATTMGKLTLKTYKGGKIKASWKNGSGNTGDITKYQVYYKQSGKKAKYTTTTSKSKTIKKLKKGKKYTVKVRAYVKINGKTYKSKWSSAKKIKCK